MKILVATDGSDFSKAAIVALANIVVKPDATSIKIISAFERPAPIGAEPFAVSAEYYNAMEEAGREQARKFVEQAETQIRALFPNAAPDLTTGVIAGSPQRAIVEKAQEWGADLIVVGSHGYGFWARLMLGSVSNSIVHNATCSVLVVRTAKDAGKSDE